MLENQGIARTRTVEEIERLEAELPNDKSPGIDGDTIEILQKGWEYMKPACIQMIQAFWIEGRFTTRASAGAIKIIHKNQDTLDHLSNWCPLTMLTFTGKLVAKLLANRIKKVASKLVDPQQSVFLEGRDHSTTDGTAQAKIEGLASERHETARR